MHHSYQERQQTRPLWEALKDRVFFIPSPFPPPLSFDAFTFICEASIIIRGVIICGTHPMWLIIKWLINWNHSELLKYSLWLLDFLTLCSHMRGLCSVSKPDVPAWITVTQHITSLSFTSCYFHIWMNRAQFQFSNYWEIIQLLFCSDYLQLWCRGSLQIIFPVRLVGLWPPCYTRGTDSNAAF